MLATETPINKATARELGALGNKIRWEAYRQQKLAEAEALKNPPLPAKPEVVADDTFTTTMLSRTREQIEKLQIKLDEQLGSEELDTKALRDITDAISKLEAVEQRLSNRPLPGSLRPKSDKPKRSQSSDPEPE